MVVVVGPRNVCHFGDGYGRGKVEICGCPDSNRDCADMIQRGSAREGGRGFGGGGIDPGRGDMALGCSGEGCYGFGCSGEGRRGFGLLRGRVDAAFGKFC